MKNVFEIKVKIVRNGGSRVFENWSSFSGISMEDFIEGLRWLCGDPMTNGRLTRELGCKRGDSKLHRLKRVYNDFDGIAYFYDEDGCRWGGAQDYASISAKDRI